MIKIDDKLKPEDLAPNVAYVFENAQRATRLLSGRRRPEEGAPVFTIDGRYTSRGWTEWTEGFQFGNAICIFDVTGDADFLRVGRDGTVARMATHVSHIGVHDHGFNNVSTYGNLLRLMSEGRIEENPWERRFYELALKVSGAVQAARWTTLPDGLGFIHSFNGPHSLFSDTVRSLRSLAVGHKLGHVLMGEQDARISLMKRLVQHAEATARYNVYFGDGRDSYDVRGRVVHESIFNVTSGAYRCPSTQQGYSPFSTWTRGLSWVLSGYPEQLEFLETLSEDELPPDVFAGVPGIANRRDLQMRFLETARAAADFYIANTPVDGVPYWDTGAPNIEKIDRYLDKPADPFNEHEPVDSSAAAICAQGLIRLGRYMIAHGETDAGGRYLGAGLTTARTVFSDPYVATEPDHEGILLHSVYHRPNGWDNVPAGRSVPCGESCMWGDYHALELGLLVKRLAEDGPYPTFFAGIR
ncbi:MAG: glycosyl hydrolase [Spirochaetaceae bacterium]|nr:MAG: glycosyl hydrolase [Spirochaetaceae bacterium]